jgi:hypothetical protein
VRRNWTFVSESLTIAADQKTVKQDNLQHYLYLPESWTKEHREEIAGRRRERFARISGTDGKNGHQLLLVIAEVKDIEQAGIGFRTVFYHLPDCPFVMEQKLHERLLRHFGKEMRMWTGKQPGHMILTGTFSVSPEGMPMLEEVCLMFVSEEWIPYDNIYELAMIQKLVAEKRTFFRILRYNRPTAAPMPTFLLTDHGKDPVALYVLDAESSADVAQVEASASASSYAHWMWSPRTHGEIPPMPAVLLRTDPATAVAPTRVSAPTAPAIPTSATLSGGSAQPVNQPIPAPQTPAQAVTLTSASAASIQPRFE